MVKHKTNQELLRNFAAAAIVLVVVLAGTAIVMTLLHGRL